MGHICNPKVPLINKQWVSSVTTAQPYTEYLHKDFNRKFLRNNKTNSKINKSGSNNIIINYISTKLGQYFSTNQVLGPILSDLRKTPFLDGFKIIVTGKLTRKERATFRIRNNKVTLEQNSVLIDYSAQGRNLRFGMVGVKVWFMQKFLNYSPYFYRLSIMFLPVLSRNILLNTKKKEQIKIIKRFMGFRAKNAAQKALSKTETSVLPRSLDTRTSLNTHRPKLSTNNSQNIFNPEYKPLYLPKTANVSNYIQTPHVTMSMTIDNANAVRIFDKLHLRTPFYEQFKSKAEYQRYFVRVLLEKYGFSILPNFNKTFDSPEVTLVVPFNEAVRNYRVNNKLENSLTIYNANLLLPTPIDLLPTQKFDINVDLVPSRKKITFNELPQDFYKYWFIRQFPENMVEIFTSKDFFENLITLHLLFLNTKMSLERFFSLCLIATTLKMITSGYNIGETLVSHYLMFPHALNLQTIQYIIKRIPILRNCGRLNLNPVVSDKIEANPETLANIEPNNLVKFEESIVLAKSNKMSIFKLGFFKEKDANVLPQTYNNTANTQPDYEKIIPENIFSYKRMFFDCKNISAIKILTPCDHIRVVHNNKDLIEITTQAHKNLLEILLDIYKKPGIYGLKILDFMGSLEENLLKFNTKKISETEFLETYWLLQDINLELILTFRIPRNLPQLVFADDLSIKAKENLAAFAENFCDYMKENSKAFLALDPNFFEVIAPNTPVYKDVKHPFALDFLKNLFPELFITG